MFQNPTLYPTPTKLINKMLSKTDLRNKKNILEPSAGIGSIIEQIQKQLGVSGMKYCNIDAIEIDKINLVPILKSKNIKVVHDNFLTYNSYKQYDLIILNPPFDHGDKHLLKSIDMQSRNGGEVVCLLNAESIKNPYSNTRKDLARKLEKYNAEIEFIEDAFNDNESLRKTNVETALIYINIKKEVKDSVIVSHLRAEEKIDDQLHGSNKVVSGDFMQEIIARYNFEIKAGAKLINEYESIKPMMSRSFDNEWSILELKLYDTNDRSNDTLLNKFIKEVRYKYWSTLFSSKDFSKLFTTELRYKYMDKLDELKEYDFSEYNIEQIKLDMQSMLSGSLEQTILDLFNYFISYSHSVGYTNNTHLYDGWKSNSAHKISDNKVVVPLSAYDWGGYYYPSHYKFIDRLRDIHKVFVYLDNGRTQSEDDLHTILKKAEEDGQTKDINCGFFTLRCFKKGTTHIYWNDKELVKKLNIAGARGRNWIPPNYGSKEYSNMTQEEKTVVDNFEGKGSYNEVMRNKSFYLSSASNLLAIEGGV